MNKYPIACVAGFILNEKNELLIGYRPADDILCVPGGKIDWAETATTAVIREIFEETGLKTEVVKLLTYMDDWFPEKDQHYVTLGFQLRVIGGTLTPEPKKFEQPQWVPLDAVPPLFANANNQLAHLSV